MEWLFPQSDHLSLRVRHLDHPGAGLLRMPGRVEALVEDLAVEAISDYAFRKFAEF
jgi:hypothetical protein